MIAELAGKYRCFSNFWSCFVTYDGVEYPSVENAYQAAKCLHKEDTLQFVHIKASQAKQLGKIIRMKPHWDDIKVVVMLELVRKKFSNPYLAKKLKDTGSEEIQEGNWWGDTFWGTVNGVGENNLGKILMKVRSEIQII